MKILITGASGFIGRAVLLAIKEIDGWEPSVVLRRPDNDPVFAGVAAVRAHIDENFEWPVSSDKFDCVIHCAGRAHVINEAAVDPLSEFRKVNLAGTIAIAKAAAAAGVRRFVFLSSIGVNGSATNLNAFDENSLPAPAANYALSKLEAEQALLALQAETSMEVVIIRPPLVYAANAPGNFQRLLRLVRSRAPLPFAGVKNKRSMVALENLVDFILRCVVHPAAANELFVIADDECLSTEEVVRHIARGMDLSSARLFRYPDRLLRLVARAAGKEAIYSQLYGSLVVDATKARQLLDWKPVLYAPAALEKAGREYQQLCKGALVK